MALDGTIAAGSNHGLKVGDTLILTSLDASETTNGLIQSTLSDTNSGTTTGTIYYVKSIDDETGSFKLATDNATGPDVTLTAAGLEAANSHSLSFHQIKLVDAGRFGGTLDLEAAAAFTSEITGNALLLLQLTL